MHAIHVHVPSYMHNACLYVHACACTFMCVHVCAMFMHVDVKIIMHVDLDLCMCVCMYVCMRSQVAPVKLLRKGSPDAEFGYHTGVRCLALFPPPIRSMYMYSPSPKISIFNMLV